MIKSVTKYVLIGSALTLAACTSVGERTLVSVGYYNISGETFNEVDQQIKLHGPVVTGVGKALASTDLRIIPNIKYGLKGSLCEIVKTRVNVKAKVTLPRHTNERRLKSELARAWSSLEEYARVHEAVHVAIADRYAIRMEDALNKLPAAENCVLMREAANQTFSELFEQHHADQLQFDQDEKERISGLSSKRSASIPR